MGIRRRRKKLTSLLSNMDRDIRSTTLRQVKRQTVVASDVTEEAETTTTVEPPVGTQIAVDPPDQWAKIIGGYYYPPLKTGGLGQVELFIDEDLQLSASEKMYVSGTEVKWNQTSGGKTYSGSFRPNTANYTNPDSTTIRVVSQYGNPSWSTRAASTKPVYASIPSGVTNSILYTVTNKDVIPSRVTLSFRGQVASYYATTTTATITFTAAHHFVAGHIVDVSDLGSPMSDVDGIVKITAIPSNTQISYEFKNPLGSSITTTTPSTTSYVNAVVSKYTTIGSSWIDSSVVPNKVYIWDGLRWAGYTDALEDGLVTNDGIAPAAPTGLNLSSLGYAEEGVLGKTSKSSVALSWTAPTTNASGGSLNDLAGYRIWYSTTSDTGPWIAKETFGQETSQTIVGLTPNLTYYFKVIAFDSYGLDSDGLDGSITAELKALSVDKASAPILESRLGTITIKWDGKDYNANVTPISLLKYVEVHYSTTTGFTPSESTLLNKIYGGAGYIIESNFEYNIDYYFKLVSVDINNRSAASSTQATIKIKPLVDADLIAAKLNAPLSSWPFAPKAVTAGALADGALDASTVFGPGVITQDAISANAIGANQIAANAITAGKINAGAVTAAKIEALAISADKIAANAVEADKIKAGAVTAVKIDAGAVTAGKITASDVFYFSGNSGTDYVRVGYEAVAGYSGSIGLNFQTSGTTRGWLGTWGDYGLEFGRSSSVFLALSTTSAALYCTSELFLKANNTEISIDGANGNTYFQANGHGFYNIDLSTYTLYVNSISNVKTVEVVGRNSTTNTLLVTGRVTANGTVLTSSRTFKEDIRPYSVPESILDIPIVSFKYNNKKLFKDQVPEEEFSEETIGVIAEDLEDLGLHDFVSYEDGNPVPTGVDYSKLGVALIPIIKAMKLEIEALKSGGVQ